MLASRNDSFMRLIECTWSCKCAHLCGRDAGHMLAGKSSECARDENWVRLTKLMKRDQQKITNSMSVQISPLFVHLSFVKIKRILRQLWCDHACRRVVLLFIDANDIELRASSSCLCAVEIENLQRCNKISNWSLCHRWSSRSHRRWWKASAIRLDPPWVGAQF